MKSNESAAAATAEQAQKSQKKSADIKLNFSEINDLFLSQKGKQLRNLNKKLDKIKDQEKLVKKGELVADEALKAKLATKKDLQAEIKVLSDLCDLYMKSNPDFNKKDDKPQLTQQDITNAVVESLRQVSRVMTLQAFIKQDSTSVSLSEA